MTKGRTVWMRGEPEEKLTEILREHLEQMPSTPLQYDESGLALPPWKVFPDYERHSMGWRMGGGEDYWRAFRNWYRALEQNNKIDCQSTYPAPDGWDDFYELTSR